jgi:hypothetical protein
MRLFLILCDVVYRVLNNLRGHTYGIGMPITVHQYDRMTPTFLVNRLMMRKKYFMASKLCKHLKRPDDDVLVDWACEKIRTSTLSDDELQVLIKSKFSSKLGVSFSEVSRHAIEAGRKKLAVMLLDDEPRVTDQVRTLLEMREVMFITCSLSLLLMKFGLPDDGLLTLFSVCDFLAVLLLS